VILERKMDNDVLNIFHPLIGKWFRQKYKMPTDIQKNTWPEISKNEHVLVTAPTGSGKTLTAFLWAINKIINADLEKGKLSVLYISPLKALNNDIQKNLITPLEELKIFFRNNNEVFPEIRVMTRSGDTPNEERLKIRKNPPEILITTPESLNIILTSKNARNILNSIQTVILDEIHSIAGDKRGTFLITAVERLSLLAGEFQRIALSATVKPLEKIANFVGGYRITGDPENPVYEKRKVKIIKSEYKKIYNVTVKYPDFETIGNDDEPVWLNLAKEFKQIIRKNKSTLFFANSKRFVEKITRLINENEQEELAYSHHGALSKELRIAVEDKLKKGELRSIVATNTLELGIDVGKLDKVVLIQTPFKISSAIQRIGRAGHSVGEISSADIYPVFGKDFIYAAVAAKKILEQQIEEIIPVENPLDILSQVILSMTVVDKWNINELYNFIKTCYAFNNISRKHFDLVIDMLSGKYADSRMQELIPRVYIDKIENTIEAKKSTAYLLFMSGGTIPDRGFFNLRLKDSKVKIGELDEEFVWERNLGEAFALGNQVWRIQTITNNDVEVTPEKTAINIYPFWKSEEVNRDFFFSEKIGLFLKEMNDNLDNKDLKNILQKEYSMDDIASEKLIDFLKEEKLSLKTDLPHRNHVVVENYFDPYNKTDSRQVVIHTFWGGTVNKPFAIALSALWEEKYGYPLLFFTDNDCIMFSLPHDFSENEILTLVNSKNIEYLLRAKLESTGYFGARFRENAGRAMLLPKMSFNKRMPLWLNRLRSKKLFEAVLKYPDFPILLETWRNCLKDDFDLDNLKLLLEEIREKKIKISFVNMSKASPFSNGVIWRQTNQYMYEDDSPDAKTKSGLKTDLIKEIIFSPHLRPKIPEAIIMDLDKKLKRTSPGYAPGTSNELISWIGERMMIPEKEWFELIEAVKNESEDDFEKIKIEIEAKIVFIKINNLSKKCVALIENIPQIMKVFELQFENISMEKVFNEIDIEKIKSIILTLDRKFRKNIIEEKDYTMDFFNNFISYYSVIEKDFLSNIFGIDNLFLNSILEKLIEDEYIIVDNISENATIDEICNTDNLERLLRMTRKAKQPVFEALPIEKIQLFLAHFQGLTYRGESIEDLQDVFDRLFGFPASVSMWEEFIITARMKTYFTSWLDSLSGQFGLKWSGCGKEKTFPFFEEEITLFDNNNKSPEVLDKIFKDKNARYNFFDMIHFSQINTSELSKMLWLLTWEGIISNDSFETFRKGILNDFKTGEDNLSPPVTFNRWKSNKPDTGDWYIIRKSQPEDALFKENIIKDRVRLLFKRYGIIFKTLLSNELPLFQWKEINHTLRLMELSGEIMTGYFFQNIPGIQFISYEAYKILQDGINEDVIYWINAKDPVSLCGIQIDEIKQKLPQRNEGTVCVFHGSKLIITAKSAFKNLEIFIDPSNLSAEHLFVFKEMLSRQFNPMPKIFIEKINNISSIKSPYAGIFKNFGFKSTYKGLELWKKF
jgi:ATP-dependent helicase Lhr and Lhr-like helicase